jgi:dolichol-phosphate mannosyltransferase
MDGVACALGNDAGRLAGGRVKAVLASDNWRSLAKKVVTGSQFATVGAMGLVVNQVLLWILVDVIRFHHILIAATIATQGSTTFNFVGAESWVFSARRVGGAVGLVKRFVAYDAVNSTALVVRLPLLQLLTAGLHMNYLVANLITLVLLTLVRYLLADSVIWSNRILPGRVS